MASLTKLPFDNSYARLPSELYTLVTPRPITSPSLVIKSADCMTLLDLSSEQIDDADLCRYFSGAQSLAGAQPLAQKYAGHQFGAYNPELGDGRGVLLGEVVNHNGERWDLHLKGAGKTPYSRMGDGRAVLRSSIREFLASEALFHLGVPTTRALCVITSEEPVYREKEERATTLLRIARTHIRFGHFEHLFHSNQKSLLNQLIDYTLATHFLDCAQTTDPVFSMFREIVIRTARMIAHWQACGFAHGVMNTDNFSIVGDTFDFGPYAFMDSFNPALICNHSDYQGRYAFNKQPQIGLWNLNCLAMAFSERISREQLISALQEYDDAFHQHYLALLGAKLGLSAVSDSDSQLIGDLLGMMAATGADYNRTFRALADIDFASGRCSARDEFLDAETFDKWSQRYAERLQKNASTDAQRQALMSQNNPKYVLRNYLAQQAISQAEQGDFSEVRRLHKVLSTPYAEQADMNHYAYLPPDWGRHMEISCSS